MGGGNYRCLGYYGGKRGFGFGKWIAGLLPWEKQSCYVEPFAGMAGVLLAREPVKREMLNDLNGLVVNWWRMVRDMPEEFGYLVEHTPLSRDEFRWALSVVDNPDLPDIRRALAFHILVSQSIHSGDSSRTAGSWQRGFKPSRVARDPQSAEDFALLAERLRKVQLENTDALELLERTADCDYAVIYCAPPYSTANTTPYSMGRVDFDRLGELLQAQKGAVAISGYEGEWDCLGWAAEWRQSVRRQIARNGEPRVEVLWRNAKCIEAATVRTLL